MEQKLKYAAYQRRLESLKEKTKALLISTGNNDLAETLNSELNSMKEREELRLAFVGQYSSGKSTIISALTGNKDIKIDANVATDVVSEYHWNNIVLLDTPGILAGKVEAHDQRTKEALEKSDLILYVLTSQLFDNVVFNNFIDLAYNQRLADKMLIVINKMGMENGEFDALVENYTLSLTKIFAERGYDISTFPIAFIDANDYIEGIDTNDDEFIEISRFEKFIGTLNDFVSKKGLIKKQFDTPIRVLQSHLKNIAVSEADETLAEFYRQFEQKLGHSLTELKRDTSNVLQEFNSSIMDEVINSASSIGEISEEDWNQRQKELNNQLTQIIGSTSSDIETAISENYKRLMDEVNEFSNKDALVKYSQELDTRINQPNISVEEKAKIVNYKKTLTWLTEGAKSISGLAPNVNDLFGGISAASGSQLHKIVLDVGHFFGKNFKPWQAVKWASNIAKVAKFGIPLVTFGVDAYMQYKDNKKENQRIQQIKSCKNQFIAGYQKEVNRLENEFKKYLNEVFGNYNEKRNEINRSKDEIIQISKRNDRISKSIKELEGEYVDFIEIIENEDKCL